MRYLQVLPLTLTLVLFLVFPVLLIGVVSFWDYNEFELLPDFVWTNYEELFTTSVTYTIYFATFKFAFLTWVFTLLIGFTVAYFLAFHVHDLKWQIVLFLLCTIPFWTSNIIRMIAWIPVLGRHGLVNEGLLALGVVDAPVEWLLFSEFSVVLAFVHLYTLFMVVPIFNSMMRIDPSVIEAAYDAGGGHVAHRVARRPAAVQARHRHRDDLRGDAGDGRLRHRADDVGRPERLGRGGDEQQAGRCSSTRPPPPTRWSCSPWC